jgi:hypothetical protein
MSEFSMASSRKEIPKWDNDESDQQKKGYIDTSGFEVPGAKEVPADLIGESILYNKLQAILSKFGNRLLKKIAHEPELWGADAIVRNHNEQELLAMIEGKTEKDLVDGHEETKFRAIVEELDRRLWKYKNYLKNLPKAKGRSLRSVK